MSTVSLAELVKKNQDRVALPAIVSKLNKLLNNPSLSVEELIHTINQDAALSSNVLKIINSPFYAFPTSVDSINAASTLLGTQQLRDMVTSTAIIKEFSNHKTLPHFDLEPFWCHSITAAIAARMTSLSLNLRDTEQYFVMGLLHDIGKIAMYLLFPTETKQLQMALEKESASAGHAEQSIFGFDHAMLGAELLNAWHFPETVVAGVAQHHSLQANSTFSNAAAITHLANVVANNLYAPVSTDDDNLLDPTALEILNLGSEKLEGIYEDTYTHMDEMLQLLYYDNIR